MPWYLHDSYHGNDTELPVPNQGKCDYPASVSDICETEVQFWFRFGGIVDKIQKRAIEFATLGR